MHFVNIIFVVADDENSAVALAEDSIKDYGEGRVWDWYEVGGRWHGSLKGNDIINAKDYGVDEFKKEILKAIEIRKNRINELFDTYFGDDGLTESAYMVTLRERLLQEVDKAVDDMKFWSLYKNCQLVLGYFTNDSYFYDGHNGTAETRYALETLAKEPPERCWLVVIDMHN